MKLNLMQQASVVVRGYESRARKTETMTSFLLGSVYAFLDEECLGVDRFRAD